MGLSMQKQLVAQQSDQMQVQWAHEEHKVRCVRIYPWRAVRLFLQT